MQIATIRAGFQRIGTNFLAATGRLSDGQDEIAGGCDLGEDDDRGTCSDNSALFGAEYAPVSEHGIDQRVLIQDRHYIMRAVNTDDFMPEA